MSDEIRRLEEQLNAMQRIADPLGHIRHFADRLADQSKALEIEPIAQWLLRETKAFEITPGTCQ